VFVFKKREQNPRATWRLQLTKAPG